MSVSVAAKSRALPGLLRHSAWDGLLVSLALAHAAVLLAAPSVPVVAIGLWWNSNTIAHNFLHSPFFRSRVLNRAFAIYLSGLLGIPQSVWRDRHLQHHAGRQRPMRLTPETVLELGVILTIWAVLVGVAPAFFFGVYAPGYVLGLGLCFLQGHFEHARGTTSHYGRLYNWLFFNDGYHVEHHLRPGEHWTRLPRRQVSDARQSRWPPVLRWLDAFSLESLERLVLRSPRLQRFVIARHERAMRELLGRLPEVRRVTIVGGGLFPRTALILRRLLPEAELTIVEADERHLTIAGGLLDGTVRLRHRWFDVTVADEADLVVIPLAFDGDRERAYTHPPARALLIHDWMWTRRAPGVSVSWLLLKRLNLVVR
jgi:fatty acid desaturase